ncbi:hypothetical protein ASZ90_010667 [hydrocarbon metagenome]|uniref:Uncharacterized protein n=1 Tax=hydrocarbon metagenome TaxID=938273 RepID=A0A0W8FFE9_9ZZZZ
MPRCWGNLYNFRQIISPHSILSVFSRLYRRYRTVHSLYIVCTDLYAPEYCRALIYKFTFYISVLPCSIAWRCSR